MHINERKLQAIEISKSVLSTYETKYKGDARLSYCIDVMERYLRGEATQQELYRAEIGARAARNISLHTAQREDKHGANAILWNAAFAADSIWSAFWTVKDAKWDALSRAQFSAASIADNHKDSN